MRRTSAPAMRAEKRDGNEPLFLWHLFCGIFFGGRTRSRWPIFLRFALFRAFCHLCRVTMGQKGLSGACPDGQKSRQKKRAHRRKTQKSEVKR